MPLFQLSNPISADDILQGLNTKRGFDVKVAEEISKITGIEFKTAPNKVYI